MDLKKWISRLEVFKPFDKEKMLNIIDAVVNHLNTKSQGQNFEKCSEELLTEKFNSIPKEIFKVREIIDQIEKLAKKGNEEAVAHLLQAVYNVHSPNLFAKHVQNAQKFIYEDCIKEDTESRFYIVSPISGASLTSHTSASSFKSKDEAAAYIKKHKYFFKGGKGAAKIVYGKSDKYGFVTPSSI